MTRTILLVATIVSALPLSGQAYAAQRTSRFIGDGRQVAILGGVTGHKTLLVMVGGDPSLKAGTQGDCELRAVESSGSWHLVPFVSDSMEISAADVRGIRFSLRATGRRAFRIDTDFGEKNCAAGLSFVGIYRQP